MHDYQDRSNAPAAGTVHLPAILAAAFAALLGAMAWGLIAWLTGYEVGYVAWGIGLLVGFAAVKLGGRGVATASTAAGLTLVAIFVGKVMGTHFLVEKEFTEVREEYFTPALYGELGRDAAAWDALAASPSESNVRQFMVDFDYGGFTSVDEIGREDLDYFQTFSAPFLEELLVEQPSFEEWRDESLADYRAEFEAEYTLASLVVDELSPIDLLFAFLAVSSAFGMISRAAPARTGPTDDSNADDQSPPTAYESRRAA